MRCGVQVFKKVSSFMGFNNITKFTELNTLRTGDADLRLKLKLCKTDDANLRF